MQPDISYWINRATGETRILELERTPLPVTGALRVNRSPGSVALTKEAELTADGFVPVNTLSPQEMIFVQLHFGGQSLPGLSRIVPGSARTIEEVMNDG